MNEGLEKIKQRLSKLIKLQQSAEKIGSQAEAQNAALRIQEMCAKYNLAAMSIEDKEERPSITSESMGISFHKKWGNGPRFLLGVIQKHTFTRILKTPTGILIIGDPMNCLSAKHLIEYMIDYFKVCLSTDWKTYKGEMKRGAFNRHYLAGFTGGLNAALERYHLENSQQCTSIMVYNEAAITQWINDQKIGVSKAVIKKPQSKINDAHVMGSMAGYKADPTLKHQLGNGG